MSDRLASNLGNINTNDISAADINGDIIYVSVQVNTNNIGTNGASQVTAQSSLNVQGQIQVLNRLNNTTAGEGQIYLNGGNGSRIDFSNNGVSPPTVTNRSVGTKLLLYSSLSSTNSDFAFADKPGSQYTPVLSSILLKTISKQNGVTH